MARAGVVGLGVEALGHAAEGVDPLRALGQVVGDRHTRLGELGEQRGVRGGFLTFGFDVLHGVLHLAALVDHVGDLVHGRLVAVELCQQSEFLEVQVVLGGLGRLAALCRQSAGLQRGVHRLAAESGAPPNPRFGGACLHGLEQRVGLLLRGQVFSLFGRGDLADVLLGRVLGQLPVDHAGQCRPVLLTGRQKAPVAVMHPVRHAGVRRCGVHDQRMLQLFLDRTPEPRSDLVFLALVDRAEVQLRERDLCQGLVLGGGEDGRLFTGSHGQRGLLS